jgi:hypothetical protein
VIVVAAVAVYAVAAVIIAIDAGLYRPATRSRFLLSREHNSVIRRGAVDRVRAERPVEQSGDPARTDRAFERAVDHELSTVVVDQPQAVVDLQSGISRPAGRSTTCARCWVHTDLKQTSTYLNATFSGLKDSMRKSDEAGVRCKPVANEPPSEHLLPRNEENTNAGNLLVN